mgnify:CR=1 FL=1
MRIRLSACVVSVVALLGLFAVVRTAVVSAQAALNRTIVDQLGGKTAEVAASATEHASASQEVTAAAEEQSASTEEMAAAAGDLLQGATRLTDAMSAFRT